MNAPSNLAALADFLASVEILSPFARAELERLAQHAESRFFSFGETVCNAGEPADGLFVIKSGSVRIFTEEHGKEISMGVRKARDVFAEIAMLREHGHESSVRASVKSELLFIPRKVILPIIARNAAAQAFITSYVAIDSAGGFVARLFDLRGKVSKSELEEFIRSVGVKRMSAGKEILKQGSREDRRLYVVRHGEVRIVQQEEGTEYPLATLRQGEIFGEKACLMRGAVGVGDRGYGCRAGHPGRPFTSSWAQPGAEYSERIRFGSGAAAAEEAGGSAASGRLVCSQGSSAEGLKRCPVSRPRRWIAAPPAWQWCASTTGSR
jgi:ATP-binding cassette subfamily B protein